MADSGSASTRSDGFNYNRETYTGRLSGQLGVLFGLALLVVIAIAFASLATWSVDDPSLSNANGKLVRNAGGFWGASFADILIQFSGLASVVALVPPAVWGWLKLIQKPIGHFRKRLVAWPFAMIVSAAAFSCLPFTQSWPLPSGLGGIFGDLVLKFPALFLGGFPSGIYAAIFFAILIVPALFLTLFASALVNRPAKADSDGFMIDPDTGEILDEDSSSGWFLGAMAHMWLTLKAMMKRRKRSATRCRSDFDVPVPKPAAANLFNRLQSTWSRLTMPPDDGLEAFDTGDRQDPDFDLRSNGDNFITAPHLAPGYGEEYYGGEHSSGEFEPDDCNDTAALPQNRITPQASRPKQGSRIVREAQPSLLSADTFELPQLGFLGLPKSMVQDQSLSADALEANARLLEGVLEDFGVKGEIINVRPGPVVTLYELEPAPGIKSSRVIGLADDIARSMSAIACRVAVVPGRNAIGIELPNQNRETVYLREILAAQDYENTKQKLALVLGKTIGGEPVIADLAKMPHLLVAGTTGSGKSVAINTMILSILYRLTPEKVKMIMIDPKMLELSIYDGIPHLLTPVVTDPKKAVVALKWTVREMEERYKKMSKLGVRNIDGYNQRLEQARKKGEVLTRTVQTGYDRDTGEAVFETEELELDAMPYIVVIIDEMADLMMVAGKDIEGAIQRLAQMARAAGIHVIMATQRPSVDVITGTIKANFPTRISFQVTSKIDSRTILGEQGAEQLLGMGDMLYMAGGGRIQRVHGPFVADDEVEKIVAHLKTQGIPQYLDSVTEEDDEDSGSAAAGTDALAESNDIYDQAVSVVLRDRKVSTSYIQRRLGIGYNRAASLIERMEKEGLIGAANHAGKREILVPDENEMM
jgi:S-DNA-T family DNA segregation ATPase FtsK/SpoIIIE